MTLELNVLTPTIQPQFDVQKITKEDIKMTAPPCIIEKMLHFSPWNSWMCSLGLFFSNVPAGLLLSMGTYCMPNCGKM